MNLSFTPEDLLEYLYKETSPERTQAIEEALRTDWSLREKMAVLQTSRERLDRLVESPRTETILRLLRYAAAENVAARY
jgi:anti-sigma factor RsiW